jgi:hypothetical protein
MKNENHLPPGQFWKWIEEHLVELQRFNQEPTSRILDKVAEVLHRFDSALGFELTASPTGELEIIVTAYGRQDSFSSVQLLVDSCPKIPGLKVIPFRQPEGADFELNICGHNFTPKTTFFEPMKGRSDPKSIGLVLFFLDADDVPTADRLQAAQIMLQAILGEYGTATRIDHIEVANSSGVNIQQYIPLTDVSAYLSWFEKRNNRTLQ